MPLGYSSWFYIVGGRHSGTDLRRVRNMFFFSFFSSCFTSICNPLGYDRPYIYGEIEYENEARDERGDGSLPYIPRTKCMPPLPCVRAGSLLNESPPPPLPPLLSFTFSSKFKFLHQTPPPTRHTQRIALLYSPIRLIAHQLQALRKNLIPSLRVASLCVIGGNVSPEGQIGHVLYNVQGMRLKSNQIM